MQFLVPTDTDPIFVEFLVSLALRCSIFQLVSKGNACVNAAFSLQCLPEVDAS
jgi:hypothetical protein